ncbi:lambda-exonuclease family protein [uncultured Ilyobacter sp.]|uniref:YqaJ viral recombinase family nuclease n=1 Tax=uncultured Ilyobacter sp. TaxID=544433 RepID=UPI002AA8E1DC|nr:YqaJ viral recombinase family protein [uncultured Ilyobacter sp.]
MTVKELREALKGKIKGLWKLNKTQLLEAYNELDDNLELIVKESLEGKEILRSQNKEEWMKIREGGLGGSDIAAVIGLNEYSSKIDVFISKTARNNAVLKQQYEEKQAKIRESEAVKMGHVLEPVIADIFQKKNKTYTVIDFPVTVKANPWEIANIDRYLVNDKGEVGILEIKTTSLYNKDKWEGDSCPRNYLCQVLWYLGITGLKYAYISCLIGGQHYRQFKIERCNETIDYLRTEGRIFWEDHVIHNIVPGPDGSSSYTEHLQFLADYAEDRGEKIEVEAAEDKVETYDELLEQRKELDKKIEKIKQEVFKEAIERGSKRGLWGKHKFSIQGGTYKGFDSKKFKFDNPDLYEQYVVEKNKRQYIKLS